MTEMLIERTGSQNFPDKLKVMVSGDPKSGKTSLLGTVPNIIVADSEWKANNLQSIAHLDVPYVKIDSSLKLLNLRMILANESARAQQAQALGLPSIDAVAIDTLDTLQKLIKRERMDTQGGKWDRDDWGWLKEELIKIVEAYTALPLHVFFMVHTKTETIGKGDDARTVVLPGLEGGIARELAGMVGYSVRSFRQEVLNPDGTKRMAYYLQTEGDETFGYLGNRAAGSLPPVIAPNFQAIYDNAMANRPKRVPESVPMQLPPQQQYAPPPQQPQQPQGQTGGPISGPPQQPQQAGPAGDPAPQQAPQQVQTPVQTAPQQAAPAAPDRPADDEPMNAAAMQHVGRVFAELGLAFPEEKVKAMTLGQGRSLVMMWQSAKQDAAEGSTPDPRPDMLAYLQGMDLVVGEAAPQQEKTVEPKVDGTIDEVKAYATDLAKVQEAYDLEITKANGGRTTLVGWLLNQGAKPAAESAPQQAPQVQTPVQNPPAEAPAQAVTPAPAQADAPPVEQPTSSAQIPAADPVALVQDKLGAVEVPEQVEGTPPCQRCGNPVDDADIARLSQGRFGEWLCVDDYMARVKG